MVDNRGFQDMVVYATSGGTRTRLGIAPGNRETELDIPPHLARGSSIRFICDPIGGGRLPVSEEMLVSPGDQVELLILGT